ncbi:hypothetical protein B0H67DRAFT_607390 [Lasiosphaeris hirsuta]|uniref:Uncharacterized protein n=1 Tax=Lasiosphaeris hirsuta TaxID=260670 RepID=A0AA40AZQ6_9PEZI|nr:hypothetical protein B0H67DRAFT_607390 [Lasiosphaeris hirsuta]
MRKRFLDSLKGSIQDTVNNATSWPGYGSPGGGGPGGFGAPPPPFGAPTNAMPSPGHQCPRQVPQAGHADWIGLPDPRWAGFNVCPACYAALIRPTAHAGAFVTKAGGLLAVPPQAAVRCDMGRFWVRVAGMVLLTMNQTGQLGAAHLAHVAGVRVPDGECPNVGVGDGMQVLPVVRRGVWFTLQDPATGARKQLTQVRHRAPSRLAHLRLLRGKHPSLLPGRSSGVCPGTATWMAGCRLWAGTVGALRRHPHGRHSTTDRGVCSYGGYDKAGRHGAAGQLAGRKPTPRARRGCGSGYSGGVPGAAPGVTPAVGCPRNLLSTTTKCHTMQGLFDLTVCENCYASVIKPDADRGVEMARRFEGNPSAMPSGFTCQLYSDRMRRVWSDAASTGDFEYLRQKASMPCGNLDSVYAEAITDKQANRSSSGGRRNADCKPRPRSSGCKPASSENKPV